MDPPSLSTCRFDESSGISFRPLEEKDLSKISAIIDAWTIEFSSSGALDYPDNSTEQLRERLQSQSSGGIVAVNPEGDEILGFIFYETTGDNILIFTHYFVSKQHRRRGIGTKLSDTAIARVKTREHWPCAARVTVSTTNSDAIRIYEKYELKKIKLIKNYYGQEQDAYMMQYIHNQIEYDTRETPAPDLPKAIRLGLLNAVGVTVINLISMNSNQEDKLSLYQQQILIQNDNLIQFKRQNSVNLIPPGKHVWLVDTPGLEILLSPLQAGDLLDRGYKVTVESSKNRSDMDYEYATMGCELCASGSWRYSPPTTLILLPQSHHYQILLESSLPRDYVFIYDISCLS